MNAVELEHPTGAVLIAYSLGQLSEQELSGIDAHLASCALCRQVVEGAAPDTLLSLLRSAATEPDKPVPGPLRVAYRGRRQFGHRLSFGLAGPGP